EIPTPVCALVRNDNVVRCPVFHLQIPICQTAIERHRAAQGKNDYTYFAHDLAVGTADNSICPVAGER
ncbi:MAG: hypothetical protein ACI4P4_15815, partial [Faecousia sp.]